MNGKKLLSLVVALTMALCLLLPAVAEEAKGVLDGKTVILHTNDMHGRAMVTEKQFGYARVAKLRDNLLDMGASVLLLDAGDASQGTPLVNLSMGKSAIEFMNAAKYDAMTVGNHEFDWGVDNLLMNREVAQFPFLAANITDRVSGELVFEANKIFELTNGMRVGVFGLATPETMTKAHPDKVKSITISMGDALYADAQKQVKALTEAKCDLIVCLAHLGVADESEPNRSIDVLNNVTGIDLMIDGHSHTIIDGGETVGDSILTSTGSYSEAIGFVIVDITAKDDQVIKSFNTGLYTMEDDLKTLMAACTQLGLDEDVDATVSAINDEVNKELSSVFAKTEVLLNGERDPGVRTMETNLGDFAADAILWAAREALGEDQVQAALTNGGGIRASIAEGDVTMLDMKTVFPFGNEVTVLTVTGAELLEALEAATCTTPDAIGAFPQVSGIEFTIDTTVPYENGELYPNSTYYAPAKPGSRVTITAINGEAFDADKLYTIATNDFTAAGGDTYYAFAYPYKNSGYRTGVALEDALVKYTEQVLGNMIGEQYAQPQGRITIK